tara:strand:- start:104 stop:460 length:357 start_codon:yes stop_codon:yes gene_type:complete
MKIKYIDYGVGNRVSDIIYLNKNLKKYPKLHKAILKHEKKHTSNWDFSDFMLDLKNDEIKGVKKDFYKFLFKHPKSLLNYFPILKLGETWCIDITLIIIYIFFLSFFFYLADYNLFLV